MVGQWWAVFIRALFLLSLAILAVNCVVIGAAFPWFGWGLLIGLTWRVLRRR
jgi:hypothetical protein